MVLNSPCIEPTMMSSILLYDQPFHGVKLYNASLKKLNVGLRKYSVKTIFWGRVFSSATPAPWCKIMRFQGLINQSALTITLFHMKSYVKL